MSKKLIAPVAAVLFSIPLIGCVTTTSGPPLRVKRPPATAPVSADDLITAPELQQPLRWSRFSYAGQVTDERGQAIPGVEVSATDRGPADSYGNIDAVKTDTEGRFKIDREPALSGLPAEFLRNPVRLDLRHADLLYTRLEDVHALPPAIRNSLAVRLRDGITIHGQATDPAGKPVPNALVQAEFEKDDDYRKATLTDRNGEFTLRGLPDFPGKIQSFTPDPAAPVLSGSIRFDPEGTAKPLALPLAAVPLAPDKPIHHLFGMALLDVDPNLQTAFFLPGPAGVLVLDAGPKIDRFDIGRLNRGDSFWIVGDAPVTNFRDFVGKLISACEAQKPDKPAKYAVRVVYRLRRPDFSGTNTQYMMLTEADLAELRRIAGGK